MGLLAGFSRSGGIVGVRPNARQGASGAAWERTGNKPVRKEINDTPDDPGPAQHPVLAGFRVAPHDALHQAGWRFRARRGDSHHAYRVEAAVRTSASTPPRGCGLACSLTWTARTARDDSMTEVCLPSDGTASTPLAVTAPGCSVARTRRVGRSPDERGRH